MAVSSLRKSRKSLMRLRRRQQTISTRLRKKGRKKKDETAAADQEQEQALEKDEKLNMFTMRMLPIEVRSAIEDKMEVYERSISSYEAEITRIQDSIKAVEAKYTVLANFLKGAYDIEKLEKGEPAGGTV